MGVMMGNYNVASKDGYIDFDGDIEKGELKVKLEGNTIMKELQNGIRTTSNGGIGNNNVSIKHEDRVMLSSDGSSSDDYSEGVRVVVVDKKLVKEKSNRDVERKVVKEKVKAMSDKKPPKAPRPPRGVSLDSADQKLIRELRELARLKRARVERMKAVKKNREAKAASSKNQLFATLLTVLFCLVLFLQGFSSRTSTTRSIRETPFSFEVAKQHSIISGQQSLVSSSATLNRPNSEPRRLLKRASGIHKMEQESRLVG